MNDHARFVRMGTPESVLAEALLILGRCQPGIDIRRVTHAYSTILSLYRGTYPGYQACSTEYHNLAHITSTFLALTRLLHGATLCDEELSSQAMTLSLVAALFHDSGYLQTEEDVDGTGAKYTLEHVDRSIAMVSNYALDEGYSYDDLEMLARMIRCTDLSSDPCGLACGDTPQILGAMVDTADLMAQIADRAYLEKLLFLYHEFCEAGIDAFDSAIDLLRKTLGFYDMIDKRLAPSAEVTDRFLRAHFAERWQIEGNPYREAMDNQRSYLTKILEKDSAMPQKHLRREGIIDEVERRFGEIN